MLHVAHELTNLHTHMYMPWPWPWPWPTGLWESEDKNGDMLISWEEFGGPKGKSVDDRPPAEGEVDDEGNITEGDGEDL